MMLSIPVYLRLERMGTSHSFPDSMTGRSAVVRDRLKDYMTGCDQHTV
jgi:hypothetical protein